MFWNPKVEFGAPSEQKSRCSIGRLDLKFSLFQLNKSSSLQNLREQDDHQGVQFCCYGLGKDSSLNLLKSKLLFHYLRDKSVFNLSLGRQQNFALKLHDTFKVIPLRLPPTHTHTFGEMWLERDILVTKNQGERDVWESLITLQCNRMTETISLKETSLNCMNRVRAKKHLFK